jgi:hypothetical protein
MKNYTRGFEHMAHHFPVVWAQLQTCKAVERDSPTQNLWTPVPVKMAKWLSPSDLPVHTSQYFLVM